MRMNRIKYVCVGNLIFLYNSANLGGLDFVGVSFIKICCYLMVVIRSSAESFHEILIAGVL